MSRSVGIDEFLVRASRALLIDVRSPSEFQRGHIPGAVNVPLFSDEERAAVGVCYKQQGRTEAILLGLDLVGPKMRTLVQQVDALPRCDELLLHCWRGGMRSQSVAWLLEQAEMCPRVLQGGYKGYRRAVQASFAAERRMVVLSGMTGAGKTQLLGELAAAGEQVLDLEALANHRGSSFGAIGLPPQPSCEQFENDVFEQLRTTDPVLPLWVEDESPSIGKVRVPQELWSMMRRSPAIYVDVPRRDRARFLARAYGHLDQHELALAIQRLERKLGGLRTQQTLRLLAEGALEEAAFELLAYYDKSYQHAAQKRPRTQVYAMAAPLHLDRLREFARQLALPVGG